MIVLVLGLMLSWIYGLEMGRSFSPFLMYLGLDPNTGRPTEGDGGEHVDMWAPTQRKWGPSWRMWDPPERSVVPPEKCETSPRGSVVTPEGCETPPWGSSVPPEGCGTPFGESTVLLEGCGKPPHGGYAIPPEGYETLPGRREVPPEQTKTQTEAPKDENKITKHWVLQKEWKPSFFASFLPCFSGRCSMYSV